MDWERRDWMTDAHWGLIQGYRRQLLGIRQQKARVLDTINTRMAQRRDTMKHEMRHGMLTQREDGLLRRLQELYAYADATARGARNPYWYERRR